jgi:hypothetical protein
MFSFGLDAILNPRKNDIRPETMFSFRGRISEFMDFSLRGWVEKKGLWLWREERKAIGNYPNRISSRKLML